MLLHNKLFEKLPGWPRGVEIEIAALQAVTADMLDRGTLHHTSGLIAWRVETVQAKNHHQQRHLN